MGPRLPNPTIQELRRFKHPKGDPRNYWFDGVSTYVVKFLYPTAITPLQVNFSASVVGICMGFLYLTNTLWGRAVGVLLFFLYITLDAVDGQLARARNDCTLKGAYLDKLGHYLVYPFASIAIGYGNYLATSNVLMIWAGFVLGLATTVSNASGDAFKAIYGEAAGATERLGYRNRGIPREAVARLLRFETMLYLVLFATLADALHAMQIGFAGWRWNTESVVISLYASALFALSIVKACVIFSRERLLTR